MSTKKKRACGQCNGPLSLARRELDGKLFCTKSCLEAYALEFPRNFRVRWYKILRALREWRVSWFRRTKAA